MNGGITMCDSLIVPAAVKTESLSPSTTQYSPLLNEGQEKSSSTIKISSGVKFYAYAKEDNKNINNFSFFIK